MQTKQSIASCDRYYEETLANKSIVTKKHMEKYLFDRAIFTSMTQYASSAKPAATCATTAGELFTWCVRSRHHLLLREEQGEPVRGLRGQQHLHALSAVLLVPVEYDKQAVPAV